MLYGLMTEEINHSYDGGLYAEMVDNRTFRAHWDGVGGLGTGSEWERACVVWRGQDERAEHGAAVPA